eukprot:COSAG02_NODE_5986_length_3888_cov_3.618105_5_plen_181_part_00
MAENSTGRAGSFPFYASGPHHSKSHENMPRYERRQGCVPQSTTHAGAWVENVEKEEKLHETLVRLGVRPPEVSYASKQPVVTGRVRAQYLTEEQRSSRREYRNMKKQLKLEKKLRRAMADEIVGLVRPKHTDQLSPKTVFPPLLPPPARPPLSLAHSGLSLSLSLSLSLLPLTLSTAALP